MSEVGKDRRSQAAQAHDRPLQAEGFPPGRFTLIYQSKDGKMCLFEDADGHLTAVRAEKLA